MNGTWDEVNITSVPDEAAAPPEWLRNLERSFEVSNLPSLYDMIGKAREESGGLKIVACSTSCKVLDLDMSAVREKVDEIVGIPTMMQIVEKARHVLYI